MLLVIALLLILFTILVTSLTFELLTSTTCSRNTKHFEIHRLRPTVINISK